MTHKEKKKLREHQSTRQLMDIRQLSANGLDTGHGELAFFILQPFNLSVRSREDIQGLIASLTDLLRGSEAMEITATDSRESFRGNRDYYRARLEQETVPEIRALLERDMAHLDEIQTSNASSRTFLLSLRLKEDAPPAYLAQVEQTIRGQGFHVRRAERQDLMTLLAVYYARDVFTEQFEEVDGEGLVIADEA